MKKRILIISVILLSFAPPVFAFGTLDYGQVPIGETPTQMINWNGTHCSGNVQKWPASATNGSTYDGGSSGSTTASTASEGAIGT